MDCRFMNGKTPDALARILTIKLKCNDVIDF